jgi:ATP-dependent protease ClpP protease subunit
MTENNWYRIENAAAPSADIFVYAAIGIDGVTAADFVKDVKAIRARVINLHINSPGGSPFDAVTMLTALKQSKASVTAYVDGLAASAASVLAMAGDRVVMARHSMMMIHEAHVTDAAGSADDMRKMADLLDLLSDNIAGIYAAHTGGSVEDWRARMATETWFNDQQAVQAGLASEVAGEDAITNEFDYSAFSACPDGACILNKRSEGEPDEEPIDWVGIFEEATEGAL